MRSKTIFLFASWLCFLSASSQHALYDGMPIGPYPVGFKIMTFTDPSRVIKPRINYFGETEHSDLHKKITVHIWYPSRTADKKSNLTFRDYILHRLQSSTKQVIIEQDANTQVNQTRRFIQGNFGAMDDATWQNILAQKMIAQDNSPQLKQKFPLIIGMLRPFSTTLTNEMLASNGYVVAMVKGTGRGYPLAYIDDVTDMKQAIEFMNETGMIDEDNIGTYGFSGSGFAQLLLAMNDYRIKALADLESAYYQGLAWSQLSSSNMYKLNRLTIPFLHIVGQTALKEEIYNKDFYDKKYSDRYRLLLNVPSLHHWDFAIEGRVSSAVLKNREGKETEIQAGFEVSQYFLLQFFNAFVRDESTSIQFLQKPSLSKYDSKLWTLERFKANNPLPDAEQLLELITRNGIDSTCELARKTFQLDSLTESLHQNVLNQMAQNFQSQNKPKEALGLMQLAVELHPKEAWLWLNLSGMQEQAKNIPEALRCAYMVMELLKDYSGTDQSFDGRIRNSAKEVIERLE